MSLPNIMIMILYYTLACLRLKAWRVSMEISKDLLMQTFLFDL